MRKSKFVESYFDAWNHHDPEGVAEHLSDDGIYCDVPEDRLRSPAELIVSLNKFFANFRHRYELIGEIQKSQDTVAFQYRIYPFESERYATNPVSYRGAEFITLRGDAAMTITDYYDVPIQERNNKYAKSGLTADQLQAHMQRLDHIMQSQKAFLRSDLTLPVLADYVGCSVNHLSQVINSGFCSSFFDYLNRYRIEHAQQLLSEADSRSSAILNIAFEVGFNSNSAFYSAFKKFVGQTPAQYRRAQINGRHRGI
jgi:AraC-like DNA-binding protein